MAQLDINVKATGIEKTTRDIKSLDNEINKTSKDAKNTSISIGDLTNSISNLSARTVAVAGSIAAIGKAFYDLTKQGVQYKSLLEDQITGLTALRVATTKNIDSMGNAISLSQKYNIAQKESLTTLKELQEVNKRTPQQLLETVELYKVLVPTLGKTGASQKELLQVTELLAKASAAYGIQFQQLIAGADGLASGTVEANSELGRFLKTLGLSNDALKDTNNVSQLVIDKLKPMSGELDTLTVANSNLTNAWNELTGVLAEPIFEPVKDGVKSLTKFLEDATVALSKFFDTFRDAENLGSIEQLNTRMIDIYSQIQDKQKQLDNAFESNRGKYSAELRKLNVDLLSAAQEYEKFTNKNVDATLVIEKQAKETENNTTKVKAHTKAIQEQNNMLVTSASDWQTYYETIGDYSTAWYFEEAELRKKYIDLNEEQFGKVIDIAKKEYFDKFKDESKKLSIDTQNIFADMTSSLTQTFEDNFFDALIGKFDNFKSFLRNFGKDILSTMFSPLARNMAGSLAGGLAGILGFQNSSLASDMSSAGLSLVNGQWVGGGETAGQPNIVVSSNGEVIKGGSLLSSMPTALNAISTLKTGASIYQSGGIGGYLSGLTGMGGGVALGPLGGLAGSAYGAGYTTLGNLLAGGNTVLTGGTLSGASGSILAGGLATAGVLGGLGGYGLGSLGDKLFGTQTKAGSYGAIGGTLGAMLGSIVPGIGTLIGGIAGSALGSLIGGMFGKTKTTTTGSGLYAGGALSEGDLSSLQSYTDFTATKKSWFSKSSWSWTDYAQITDDLRKTIQGAFVASNNIADVFKQTFGTDILVGAGKYSGESLLSRVLPEKIIQQVTNATSSAMYNAWSKYAKEVNKSVLQVMQEKASEFQELYRTFALYNTDDATAKLKLQAEFAKADYELLAEVAGIDVANITVENFTKRYQEALQANFTAENIDNWNKLGEALLAVTEANKAYEDSLTNFNNSLISATDSLTAYVATAFESFANGFNNIFGTAVDLSSRTSSTLSTLRGSSTTEFNKLIAEFESIKGTTDTARISDVYNQILAMSGTLGKDIRYGGQVESLLTGYKAGFDYTKDVIRVSIVDGLQTLLSLNEEQTAQLKDSVKDGVITNNELSNISNLTDIQKAGILEVANNSQYFSTESTLSTLEEYSKLQLESLRKATETQTESLSAKTLTYGDTVGLQEQIDLARLFGASYESISPFISQVQGLDVSQNLSGDIGSIIASGGYENLMKLSPYLSSDIVSTAQTLQADKQDFLARYELAMQEFNQQRAESDQAKSYYESQWHSISAGDSGARQQEDFVSGTPYLITSPPYINEKNVGAWQQHIARVYAPYQREFADTYNAYKKLEELQKEKAAKGYYTGGYTGNGGKYDVAGVVHRGEYVVNQEQLRNVGGVSGLENALRGGNDNLIKILSSELSQLRSDFATLLKQFKSVTNNGDQMRVKLIS